MAILYNILVVVLMVIVGGWAVFYRDPHLLFIRSYEAPLYIASVLVLLVLCRFSNLLLLNRILFILIPMLAAIVIYDEYNYKQEKHRIVFDATKEIVEFNKRFIIGFNSVAEVRKLAENGIAGIFLTKRNIDGETFESVRDFIRELQDRRKARGLPPLIVATDQEGGPVSRLSPLVERQKALADVYAEGKSIFKYGKRQGESLRRLGVTVNFSPVVDLKSELSPGVLDFHSLIVTRAISPNPRVVTQVSLEYIRGLESEGVIATLKHFPGLARVQSDTHHFSATLTDDVEGLEKQDLLPFEKLAGMTKSWIMLSHITLAKVDEANPVSTSNKVINGLIRAKLKIQSTLITDDMTMGATYNRGYCKSIRQSYSAGVDYLLVAYDYEKYYDAILCLEEI